MKATKKRKKKRFRKNLAQFIELKDAGRLNGKAAAIEDRLKNAAGEIGLAFGREIDQIKKNLKKDNKMNADNPQAGPDGEPTPRENNHTAEKIRAGEYKYRDFKIKKSATGTNWYVIDPADKIKHSWTTTLESAKHNIDQYYGGARENPVKVPFSVTIEEIADMHNIYSPHQLNSMLGAAKPCYTKKPWESTHAHISVLYTPNYQKKIYNLDLLLDGHLDDRICTEGEGSSANFKACFKILVERHGDLEVIIYDQGHAKKVLGAKRYKKQERQYAQKMDDEPARAAEKEDEEKEEAEEDVEPEEPATDQEEPAGDQPEPEPPEEPPEEPPSKQEAADAQDDGDQDEPDLAAIEESQNKIDEFIEEILD